MCLGDQKVFATWFAGITVECSLTFSLDIQEELVVDQIISWINGYKMDEVHFVIDQH